MRKTNLLLFFWMVTLPLVAQPEKHVVKNLKITILSTMMAQAGVGEWGFSALVEADSHRILFDAGGRERTVLENSKELEIDLADVPTLILSHNHRDHTAGWLPLRNELLVRNQKALVHTHVAQGLFDTRVSQDGNENNARQSDSSLYVQSGGIVTVHKNFIELFPGIYLTGPVPRKHPEKNYPANAKKKDASGKLIDDTIPEDMSLIIRTEKGLVIISGCGHSGIINTIEHARGMLKKQPMLAAIGGFHLLDNTDEQIKWTAEQLKRNGVRYFMGAHCTGIEPVYQIREWAALKRGECIVGSIGATFDLEKGFVAGPLTR